MNPAKKRLVVIQYRIPIEAQKARALGPAPQGAPWGPLVVEKAGDEGEKIKNGEKIGKK